MGYVLGFVVNVRRVDVRFGRVRGEVGTNGWLVC